MLLKTGNYLEERELERGRGNAFPHCLSPLPELGFFPESLSSSKCSRSHGMGTLLVTQLERWSFQIHRTNTINSWSVFLLMQVTLTR
jgi:hypothetical protein